MKIRNLFEDYDEDELFWESMQDHGWKPRGARLVSTRDPRISVIRDRRMYYRNIEIGIYTDKKYAELLRFESDPKVQTKWCSQNHLLLRFASFESVQLAAVRRNGYAIRFIQNPSEAVQLAAVRQTGLAIRHIENPSEAVQLAAVQKYGRVIQFIKNPSETVQLAAVRQNILAILYIENPSEAVRRAAQQ